MFRIVNAMFNFEYLKKKEIEKVYKAHLLQKKKYKRYTLQTTISLPGTDTDSGKSWTEKENIKSSIEKVAPEAIGIIK